MKFIVQLTRAAVPSIGLETVDGLAVNELLDSLSYPILWWRDDYLRGWFPSEIDPELARWLTADPYRDNTFFDEASEYPPEYVKMAQRAGLYAPKGRVQTDALFVKRRAEGSVKIPSMFHPAYAEWMTEFFAKVKMDRWRDMDGISRASVNDHPLMRLIHAQIVPFVQEILARRVKPSYSFTAIYDNNSSLPKHTDRPQCVYNISLMLGATPGGVPLSSWPLYVDSLKGKVHEHRLETGDAAIYYGTKHPHWRDKIPPGVETVTGAFLHYVPISFEGTLA